MGNTARNLMVGFVKESQISTRYEIYTDIARKENFLLLYKTFKELSTQKKERAISFYKILRKLKFNEVSENLVVEIKTPTTFGTTIENLEACINESDELWQKLYPDFESAAKIEGHMDIANRFKEVTQTERNSSQRLKMFLNLFNSHSYSKQRSITFWKCLACGYEVGMNELPNDFSCPSCGHFKSYFQRKTMQLITDEKLIKQKEVSGWVCMECGYEVPLEELPEDWRCGSCGRSKAYFKRKILKSKDYEIESTSSQKAHWVCLECGNEEEIDLPAGWTCSKCGFPRE